MVSDSSFFLLFRHSRSLHADQSITCRNQAYVQPSSVKLAKSTLGRGLLERQLAGICMQSLVASSRIILSVLLLACLCEPASVPQFKCCNITTSLMVSSGKERICNYLGIWNPSIFRQIAVMVTRFLCQVLVKLAFMILHVRKRSLRKSRKTKLWDTGAIQAYHV